MKKVFYCLMALLFVVSISCTPESISDDSEINPTAIDKDKIEPTKPPKGN